jgi:electron transfer flavoprotein beta subunit
MKIAICIKQVLDPDIPTSELHIDSDQKTVSTPNPSWVINIFDENALETALHLRDAVEGSELTALSFGPETCIDSLRKALAMQADHAVLISDQGVESADSFAKTKIIAATLNQLGPFDLILCGRETADWHGGKLGSFLAEELGLPCVNFVTQITQKGENLHLRRQTESGVEILEISPPAVLTITNDDTNLPRIPKVRDSMMAFRKEIPTLTLETLNLNAQELTGTEILDMTDIFIPESDQQCLIVEGEDGMEKAQNLISKMEELKIV